MLKEEHRNELLRIAPNLFSTESRSSAGGFEFEIRDGWFGIVKDLASKLEPLIASLPESSRSETKCCQVKQKMGGLRFYMYGIKNIPEASELVRLAEANSEITCEECGLVGEMKNVGGYVCVLCKTHLAEAKRK